MKHAISYLNTLSLMLEARKRGNEVDEDCFLDKLDVIWLKLSGPELSLIKRISMYIARDLLSLSSLKKLTTRLSLKREFAGAIATVRVYRVQGTKKAVQKKSSLTVFRLPSSADIGRRSAVKLVRRSCELSVISDQKSKSRRIESL